MDDIREIQDRAISYLLASPEHMAALIRLAAPELAARIDPGSLRELKTTLIPEDLRKRVEDVLCEGLIDGDRGLLVLVAHQSVGDPIIAARMLIAMAYLFDGELHRQQERQISRPKRRLRQVLPLVIHTGRRPWTIPPVIDLFYEVQGLEGFIPRFDLIPLDLAATNEERLLAEGSALAYLLNLFRAQYDEAEGFARSLARSLEGLKALTPDHAKFEAWLRFAIFFSFQRRGREEWGTMTDVARDVVGERGRGMGETIAEFLHKQGLEQGLLKGREEGREEGRLEGSRALLAELLAASFPDRTADDIRRRLADISERAVLEVLGRRLIAEKPTWDELWG